MNANNINETFTKTYEVYEPRMAKLEEQLAKLSRRSIKLGCLPITIVRTGEVREVKITREQDLQHSGLPIQYSMYTAAELSEVVRVLRFIKVTVSGQAPKFNGWNLAAVIEHAEEANLIRKSPNCTIELAQYRECAPVCDHCHTKRNRRDTYVVVNDAGDTKQVGSNCIKDFLGHQDPHTLVALADLVYSVASACEDAFESDGNSGNGLPVSTFLVYASMAIRMHGFVSGKRMHEDLSGRTYSTANTAMDYMYPPKNGKPHPRPDDCDRDAALKAAEYVLESLGSKNSESLSDFEHNLLTVVKCSVVEPRNAGLLAFVPEFYRRSIEDRKSAALEAHYGEPKLRARGVKITYVKSTGFDSNFGYTFIHSFAGPAGERLIWKSSSNPELVAGQEYSATFTVKEHGEYKGHKQTKITRLVIDEPATVKESLPVETVEVKA